jgi:transposase
MLRALMSASEHYVAVRRDRAVEAVHRFGAFTEDLHALARWLLQYGVQRVPMESPGVYWIPLYQILEELWIQSEAGECEPA